jgi:membrane protease YdiL (CAAX protease family)
MKEGDSADPTKTVLSLFEVFLFYCFVQILIWQPLGWRPPILVAGFVMVGFCLFSNRWHGDSLERVGLSNKKFWPCFKLIAPLSGVLFVPVLILAIGKKPLEGWDFWFSVFGYPLWAFAQDYALLGFVANRLEEGFRAHRGLVPWANGFLFSLAHAPNPVLMSATFLAGVIFTFVFLKERHLIPIAFVHALFGVGLSFACGQREGLMSVGPGYLSLIGR